MNIGTVVGNEDLITELHHKKWSLRAIGRELKVEPTAIAQKLELLGLRTRLLQKPRLTKEIEVEIVLAYANNIPIRELSAKYDLACCTIRAVVKRNGAQVFARGNRLKKFSDETLTEIRRLYCEEKLSQVEIAKRFETSQILVSRYLSKLGLTRQRNAGAMHPSYKGGRIVNDQGYVSILIPVNHELACMRNSQGYIAEHRLKMALTIKRPLAHDETVHHINGNVSDNRIENLQLRQGKHGKGVVHRCSDCGSNNIIQVPLAEPVDS